MRFSGTEPRSMSMARKSSVSSNWIVVTAFSFLFAVLGFAYGNALGSSFQFKDWQPLIGAIVAACALVATWMMASRTLRLNTISREETRIEENLPKLREAVEWLSQVAVLLQGMEGRHQTSFVLESFVNRSSPMQDQISKAIPLADARMVQQIAQALLKLYGAAEQYKYLEQQLRDLSDLIDGSRPITTEAERDSQVLAYADRMGKPHIVRSLDKARGEFLTLCSELEERRMKLESRLVRIRAEIDHYLDAE